MTFILSSEREIYFLQGQNFSSQLWNASGVCAYVQRQVPILALTATASPATVGKIERSLAMANTIQIVRSADRENIRLVLQAYGKDDGDHKGHAAVPEDLLANA